MEELRACIQQQVFPDDRSLNQIISRFTEVEVPKGSFWLKAGNISRQMAFIASGYLRMFDHASGKEVTLWIGGPGRFITSVTSFVFQSENHWNIQALTPVKLYALQRSDHQELCELVPKWLEFDNLLLAHSFALLERKMFDQLHTTAQERYELLLREEPDLFLHVPLQYLASMLGIAPESMSRLRKKLVEPNS